MARGKPHILNLAIDGGIAWTSGYTVYPWKEALKSIWMEVRWAPELVWTLLQIEKFFSCWNQNFLVNLVGSWIILVYIPALLGHVPLSFESLFVIVSRLSFPKLYSFVTRGNEIWLVYCSLQDREVQASHIQGYCWKWRYCCKTWSLCKYWKCTKHHYCCKLNVAW